MATKDLKARLKLKYDLYANWIANDPVLLAGEAAIAVVPAETNAVVQEPCVLIKIGDGTKKFSQLPFVSGIAADVYNWAKEATKPSYTAEEISGLDAYISGKVQDTNTTYKIEVDSIALDDGTNYTDPRNSNGLPDSLFNDFYKDDDELSTNSIYNSMNSAGQDASSIYDDQIH